MQDVRERAEEQLHQLSKTLAVAEHEVARMLEQRRQLECEQGKTKAEAELFAHAIAGLNLLMETTVTKNLSKLSVDVNRALQAIVPDQDVTFEVIPEVKWGKQVYSFGVKHNGMTHTDAEGIGGTVLSIVAMVLRVLFILHTKRYKLLVLDESLSFISKSYRSRASQFVSKLAHAYGMHVLLITHDETLASEADVCYRVIPPKPGAEADGVTLLRIDAEEMRAYFRSEA